MTNTQGLLFFIIAATLVGFVWARWRYDVVAVLALLTAVYAGVVPMDATFVGFGHPAVITVGAVLVISRALQNAGLVNRIVRLLAPTRRTPTLQVAAGSGLTLLMSAVMNNVGALALMLPVTIRNAARAKRQVSLLLIPLSFASLLGGLITLIGTPPNLVIAAFRQDYSGEPFAMFDFTPVGAVVALAGLVYLSTLGWRLLPQRESGTEATQFQHKLKPFVAEVRVPEGSPFDGQQIRSIEEMCENEITIMTIIHDGERMFAPIPIQRLRAGDLLVIEGDPSVWEPLCDGKQFDLLGRSDVSDQALGSQDVVLVEAVVMPNSALEGRSARNIRMHDTFGINLLALARRSQPTRSRLKNTRFRVGDVLFIQGEDKRLERALSSLGCLVLADRGAVSAAARRGAWLPLVIFAAALASATLALVTVPVALVSAAMLLILTRVISLREAYDSVEWPIIVLLGALIPLGQAMTSTGAAAVIADGLIAVAGDLPVWAIIALVMVVSMWLSDLIHNTPTAVLMAPVGASIAEGLQLSVDPFLMAIAVGSASAYLTPIGHQSNTLVMGPGSYRFTDYARVGILLESLIVLVGVPMIILVWL
ncbi:MAG: SLC13 family permease [Gammaproteobacteria bacterium]